MSNQSFIDALLQPSTYPHPVSKVGLVETHLSWVFLTGEFAYKVKKPVTFSFANFATLEQRHQYCLIELALNRELNNDIYLTLVTINQEADGTIKLNGAGAVLDYALKMRQFDQTQLLSQVIMRDQLTPAMIDTLAQDVAAFHLRTEIAPSGSEHGTPQNIWHRIGKNFTEPRAFLTEARDLELLAELEKIAITKHARLADTFSDRKAKGFVRSCHGDLHLRNMVLINQQPVIFDRIEFNELYRWIDVMADIAFMVMDLAHHQHQNLATRFLNQYLSHTGDYYGLTVLRYYITYRALVRAKIHLFETDFEQDPAKKLQLLQFHRKYAQLAKTFNTLSTPRLFIMHGVSGSGKSTVAQVLAEHTQAIYIRADVERKRLFKDLDRATLYHPDTSNKVHQRLLTLSQMLISNGYSVIVDATFIEQRYRTLFANLATDLNVAFGIIACTASKEKLQQHITHRATQQDNVSDANLAVLDQQLTHYEPLSPEEQARSLTINTDAFPKPHAIISDYQDWFGKL